MTTALQTSATWTALGCDVVIATTDPEQLDAARTVVTERLEEMDQTCSRFIEDSELSRLNAQAGAWIEVSPLLLDAVRTARDVAEFTGGLVDPTVGHAIITAGYDVTFAEMPPEVPTPLSHARRGSDWKGVRLDFDRPAVKIPAGTSLDLGATGKALIADLSAQLAAALTDCGVLVCCGGDVAVSGNPPSGDWPVEVSELGPGLGHSQIVHIHAGGLATSGTAERRWRRGGKLMHHIIDPRTGEPADTPWLAVSATGVTCVAANAATTAAMVLGEDAPRWLEARYITARLVATDGRVVRTYGWPE